MQEAALQCLEEKLTTSASSSLEESIAQLRSSLTEELTTERESVSCSPCAGVVALFVFLLQLLLLS